MSLLHALERALVAQYGAVVQDGDGSVWTGPQLLRLAAAAARLVQQAADHALGEAPSGPPILAIFLSNSAAYVVAALAALRLGMAFMPLDPDWPPQRLQQLCDEAQPVAVLWAASACPGGHGQPCVAGWSLMQLPGLTELLREGGGTADGAPAAVQQQQQPQQPGQLGPQPTPAGDACYLLYTSGSTGRPLGVLGTQAGVLNRCRWLQRAQPFQAGDRVAFKTAPAFVDSIWEVFGPLLAGVPLVAVPRPVARDPGQLLCALADNCITHVAAVPTLWRALLASMQQDSSMVSRLRLRLAVSSGEPLLPALLADMQQQLPPGCRLLNLYGSTEVAADCTAFDCTAWRAQQGGQMQQNEQPAQQQEQEQPAQQQLEASAPDQQHLAQPAVGQPDQQQRVAVGQPISGMLVAVLAPEGSGGAAAHGGSGGALAQPHAEAAGTAGGERAVLPLGSIGEVAVAGPGLAAGYLCRHPAAEAAQRRRFVRLPTRQLAQAQAAGTSAAGAADLPAEFWQQGSVRAFLTGDLGWMDAAGCLHLLGRRDHQVKILGVRVDLAEVEAALGQHASVAAAAAKLWHLPAGPVLAAYVQFGEQQPHSSSAVAGPSAPAAGSNELRSWCQARLPPAAVPQHVVVLPRLPRSAAGKVQRSQLPHPLGAGAAAGAEAEAEAAVAAESALQAAANSPPSKRPRSGATAAATTAAAAAAAAAAALQPPAAPGEPISELAVSRAFAAALGHSAFEATTNLFSIGGNSLMAAQIAGRVAGGDVEAVFSHPTVRSLAAFLAGRADAPGAPGTTAAAASGGGGRSGQQLGTHEAGMALHARRLDLSASLQPSEQQEAAQPGRPQLRLAWRAKMLQCVDAAPVFGAAGDSSQQAARSRVFACSHGGNVCCYDARSGRQLWSTHLPDRTDAGLVLCGSAPLPRCSTQSSSADSSIADQQPGGQPQQERQQQQQQFVAAATNGGTLAFLRSADGSLAGSLECGGGIRAPPVCDPWCGLVWQPTHGRQLVVAAAPGEGVARLGLPAAASAAVSFDAERRLALVCCLDGSLVAVAVQPQQLAAAATAAAEEGAAAAALSPSGSGSPLAVAWRHQASVPLFAPATLLPGGTIAVGAVDGSISCLASSDGRRRWRAVVQGAVFVPMLLLPSSAGRAVLLVGTQAGQLAALDPSTGRQLGALQLGAKITGMQLLPLPEAGAAGAVGAAATAQQHCVAITLANGIVAAVQTGRWLGSSSAALDDCLLDAVQLPADVFAAPAVSRSAPAGAAVAVGCRDDHLYCFHLAGL